MPKDYPDGRPLPPTKLEPASDGYKPLEVETHYDSRCRYKKNWQDKSKGHRNLERACYCDQYVYGEETTEEHYSLQCHWKKIIDEESKIVYLYRKCYCEEPDSDDDDDE